MDSYFALAAFVLLIVAVALGYFLADQIAENERTKAHNAAIEAQVDYWVAAFNAQAAKIAPFDHDGDGRPGGRERHDPYIER